MFEGTQILSYALILFLLYVYLPYTFFKFGSERFIDLGKRRDFTQLEEIISAFIPTVFLHAMASAVYFLVTWFRYWPDPSIFASMMGSDRGAVSDYIYAGDRWFTVLYIGLLWVMSFANGLWFGWSLQKIVSKNVAALHGVDELWSKKNKDIAGNRFFLYGWRFWFLFFHESIVPLFTWGARQPIVRVETSDHRVYYGKFLKYEKTTDGRLDAIRLAGAKRHRSIEKQKNIEAPTEIIGASVGTLFLKWSNIAEIIVVDADPTAGTELCSDAVEAWRVRSKVTFLEPAT